MTLAASSYHPAKPRGLMTTRKRQKTRSTVAQEDEYRGSGIYLSDLWAEVLKPFIPGEPAEGEPVKSRKTKRDFG
jgi:hypothetical protein